MDKVGNNVISKCAKQAVGLLACAMFAFQGCVTQTERRSASLNVLGWGPGVLSVESSGRVIRSTLATGGMNEVLRCQGALTAMTWEQACTLARTYPVGSVPRALVVWGLFCRGLNSSTNFLSMDRSVISSTIGTPDVECNDKWRYLSFTCAGGVCEGRCPAELMYPLGLGTLCYWDFRFGDNNAVTSVVPARLSITDEAALRGWLGDGRSIGPFVKFGSGVNDLDGWLTKIRHTSDGLFDAGYWGISEGMLSALSWNQACAAYRSALTTPWMKDYLLRILMWSDRVTHDEFLGISENVLVNRLGPPDKQSVRLIDGGKELLYAPYEVRVSFLSDSDGCVRQIQSGLLETWFEQAERANIILKLDEESGLVDYWCLGRRHDVDSLRRFLLERIEDGEGYRTAYLLIEGLSASQGGKAMADVLSLLAEIGIRSIDLHVAVHGYRSGVFEGVTRVRN
jgi:hypothetical protein